MVDEEYVSKLESENARLSELLNMPASHRFESMMENGELVSQCEIEHWAMKLIAASLSETLGDAPNFVTLCFNPPEGKLEVTVRRVAGKSPAEAIGELQARISELEQSSST